MGLIREVQGVSASINKQERARRERERLKILQENYKKELESDLKSEFLNIYNKTDIETAYKIIVLEKDSIIEKIYNIISKITYEQDGKRYYTYFNFDIIEDLQENYFKILQKVKKEINISQTLQNKKLFYKLKKKMAVAMNTDENKYFLSIALQKNENIKTIVNSITTDETEKEFLFYNYEKALKQVIQLYHGDIIKNKMDLKAQKEQAKNENRNKITRWLLFNYIMTDLLKMLPKSFNKKRKY